MRIAIVGAGAIGCFLAARLVEHGHDITLVGRAPQAEAITRDGLVVREPDGATTHRRVRAVTALTEAPDLVLLTVKTQDVTEACRALLPVASGVPVVAMQNGLEGDRLAGDVLGRENVLGAVVMCATTYLNPGEISVQFAGWLILGEPFGPVRSRTRAIAGVLRDAAPTYVTSHLTRARWTKLISNLNNGICAATGKTMPELPQTATGRLISVRVMKEGYRVARAAGIHLDHGFYGFSPSALRHHATAAAIAVLQSTLTVVLALAPEQVAMSVLRLAGHSRLNQVPIHGSTWQSITRGRPSEIAYLNGAIVRLGKQLDIPTPYNTRLVEVVREVERTQRFRGVDDLLPQAAVTPARVTSVGEAE